MRKTAPLSFTDCTMGFHALICSEMHVAWTCSMLEQQAIRLHKQLLVGHDKASACCTELQRMREPENAALGSESKNELQTKRMCQANRTCSSEWMPGTSGYLCIVGWQASKQAGRHKQTRTLTHRTPASSMHTQTAAHTCWQPHAAGVPRQHQALDSHTHSPLAFLADGSALCDDEAAW